MSLAPYKFTNFDHSVKTLCVALARDWRSNDMYRDSVIRRFKLSLNSCLTFFHAYLTVNAIDIIYPKDIFRNIFMFGYISEREAELCLGMIDEQKLLPLAYEEDLAAQISDRIVEYQPVLAKLAAKAQELA